MEPTGVDTPVKPCGKSCYRSVSLVGNTTVSSFIILYNKLRRLPACITSLNRVIHKMRTLVNTTGLFSGDCAESASDQADFPVNSRWSPCWQPERSLRGTARTTTEQGKSYP